MKKIQLLFAALLFAATLPAQVITLTPALPTDLDSVTVIFDATQGNQGLKNYAGDVYAHTGVITSNSTSYSDWKYVRSGWGVNIPSCKLTRLDANRYALTMKPSIREFYAVPAGEKILKLAFVFRSGSPYTGTTYYEGKDLNNTDIFGDVFEAVLNVSFSKPSSRFTLDTAGQQLEVEVNSLYADSMNLSLNGVHLQSSYTSQLLDTITASGNRLNMLVAKAFQGANVKTDTAWYLVKGSTQLLSIPEGVRDGINYMDNSTVTMVLHAPYKEFIYLLGDFNNWMPDSAYQLNRDGDRFWVTLPGLTPGCEYRFQYLVDGNLRIADPYSEKILDPWNDKYISASIYPSLLPYPSEKTTEIAGVLQTGQTPFNWEASAFTAPPLEKLVIYEMLIRDFTGKGDIKTITDTLTYLKRLGVNAIELMPISEFEGNDSWGYNPSFYFAPDKAYGTKEDYKRFIDACHKNGIAVIQDMVLNHSYGQSPLVRLYFDGTNPTAQNPWYNVSSPNTTYYWGYDFNHQSTATQAFVDRVTSWWLTEYKVDGFRFDFSKGFTNKPGDGWAYDTSRIRILKRMADAIWSVNPNAYVILEHLTDNKEEKELAAYNIMLWGNMTGTYSEAAMGYNESGKSNFSAISYKNRGWSTPRLVGYMESHDEERLMYKNLQYGSTDGIYNLQETDFALKRMELNSAFFYPVPGPKMLWQFGELGYDITIDYNGRLGKKPLHWEYQQEIPRKTLFNVISKLVELKKTEEVFSTADFNTYFDGSFKRMTLRNTQDTVLIFGNFDVFDNYYDVTFPSSGYWFDFLNADSLLISNPLYNLHLDAGEYRLFSKRKLHGFGSIKLDVASIRQEALLNIYPNPVTNSFRIAGSFAGSSLDLYDLSGRLLLRKTLVSDGEEIFVDELRSGLYLVRITGVNGMQQTSRIVISH
ncbi:MAG: alpha-amylase family glycosyl hydrolase [Bacteroidales bacterium]